MAKRALSPKTVNLLLEWYKQAQRYVKMPGSPLVPQAPNGVPLGIAKDIFKKLQGLGPGSNAKVLKIFLEYLPDDVELVVEPVRVKHVNRHDVGDLFSRGHDPVNILLITNINYPARRYLYQMADRPEPGGFVPIGWGSIVSESFVSFDKYSEPGGRYVYRGNIFNLPELFKSRED